MISSVTCHPVGDGCIFQVPNVSQRVNSHSKATRVAVLDSSGSMNEAWAAVARSINKLKQAVGDFPTITFDTTSRRIYGELSENLYDHGGGLTNIKAGVELLKEVITELRGRGFNSFLVIFVSDGHDTSGNGRNEIIQCATSFDATGMEFTTVGIGNSFPTHVSMALRSAFHRGRVNLPNLTLVDDTNHFEEIFNDLVKEFLESDGLLIKIAPSVRAAPWQHPVQEVFEKTWVLMDAMPETVKVCEEELALILSEWSLSTGEAAIKQWINMVHALAACGHDVRHQAVDCLRIVRQIAAKITEAVEESVNAAHDRSPSVYQRLRKMKRSTEHELYIFEKELKDLAAGGVLFGLSDADLAKRLAIGTKQGKHHKRAMRWKGVTTGDFGKYLTRFRMLMDNHLEDLRNGPEDENRSAVSLESNTDILLQEDLPEAIKALGSQYFLVECVPVVGQPVMIKVTNASMIHPWKVKVESISRHTPMLDTCTILELGVAKYGLARMPLGMGQIEAMNAVCPLFTKEVARLIGPFMRSELYQMLMTHTVCKNIDMVDPDSHPALLAALMCNLLREPKSGWRDGLIGKVLDTMNGIYIDREPFKCSVMYLKDTPQYAMVTESPDLSTKCEAMSKPLLLAMCVAQDLDTQQKTAIIERMYIEHIGRALGNNRQYSDWFKVLGTPRDSVFDFSFEHLRLNAKDFLSWPKFSKAIRQGVSDLVKTAKRYMCVNGIPKLTNWDTSKMKVKFNEAKLALASKKSHDPVNLQILDAFSEWLVGEQGALPISKAVCVIHGCIHPRSYDRATYRVIDRGASRELILRDSVNLYYSNILARVTEKMVKEGEALYFQNFNDTHRDCVLPMTWKEICQKRAEMGLEAVEAKTLGYDEGTGLCKRACMSPKCDFFLVKLKNLGSHLSAMRRDQDDNEASFVEAFHRCIRDMRHRSDEEIEEACVSGKYTQRPSRRDFGKAFRGASGVDFRGDISLIKNKYRQMYG